MRFNSGFQLSVKYFVVCFPAGLHSLHRLGASGRHHPLRTLFRSVVTWRLYADPPVECPAGSRWREESPYSWNTTGRGIWQTETRLRGGEKTCRPYVNVNVFAFTRWPNWVHPVWHTHVSWLVPSFPPCIAPLSSSTETTNSWWSSTPGPAA